MDEIDTTKLRGKYQSETAAGDDTVQSIKLVADKVNEIVRWANKHGAGTHTRIIQGELTIDSD